MTGAGLAGALGTAMVMPGVVNLPTGARYDPMAIDDGPPLCANGNPNVLTRDLGTSKLAQGCCGQVTIAEVTIWKGELPGICAYGSPPLVSDKAEGLLPGFG